MKAVYTERPKKDYWAKRHAQTSQVENLTSGMSNISMYRLSILRLKQRFLAWRRRVKQKHPDNKVLALSDYTQPDQDLKLLNASDDQLKAFIENLSIESVFERPKERALYQSVMDLLVGSLPHTLRKVAYYLILAERIARYQVMLDRLEWGFLRTEGEDNNKKTVAAALKESPKSASYSLMMNEWRKCMELFGNQRWADEKKVKEDIVKELRNLRNTPLPERKLMARDVSTEAKEDV